MASRLRKQVQRYDTEKRHEKELLGRGTLTVVVEPGDAELYLFRYEEWRTVRPPPVVTRLVPVPTTGLGRVRDGPWLADVDFFPGDLCLVITAVEKGSLAAKKGLRPGDLVIRASLPLARCGGLRPPAVFPGPPRGVRGVDSSVASGPTATGAPSAAAEPGRHEGWEFGSGNTVYVVNVAGNRHCLVAAIHFNTMMVFVLRIMTHKEYDRERWKEEL